MKLYKMQLIREDHAFRQLVGYFTDLPTVNKIRQQIEDVLAQRKMCAGCPLTSNKHSESKEDLLDDIEYANRIKDPECKVADIPINAGCCCKSRNTAYYDYTVEIDEFDVISEDSKKGRAECLNFLKEKAENI